MCRLPIVIVLVCWTNYALWYYWFVIIVCFIRYMYMMFTPRICQKDFINGPVVSWMFPWLHIVAVHLKCWWRSYCYWNKSAAKHVVYTGAFFCLDFEYATNLLWNRCYPDVILFSNAHKVYLSSMQVYKYSEGHTF